MTNATVQPGAVMVHPCNTSVADAAMVRSRWFWPLALVAVPGRTTFLLDLQRS